MTEPTRKSVPLIQSLLSNYIGSYRTVIALSVFGSSCCISFGILDYLSVKGKVETKIVDSQYCRPVIDDVIGQDIPEVYCDMGDSRYYFSIDGKSIEELYPPKTVFDKLRNDVDKYVLDTSGCQ